MATETVNRQINIFIESGEAQKVYDKLIEKEKALNAQIKETSDPKRIKALNDELSKLQEPLSRAAKKVSGELSPSFKELQSTVNTLGNRLKKMSVEDADYSKVLKQYNQANESLTTQKKNLDLVKQAQNGVAESTSSFGKIFTRVAEYFGAYAIIETTLAGIKDLIKGSIDEAVEAEEKTARFKATLDNLGKTEVFDRLKQKADEMAQRFKYLDNDDVVAVFEKLIDYGKLTEDQINQLTPVIINFAAKQRISITEATDVITKALEGNAKALKTYGINISEASTPAERLKIIMTELKDKVDGAGDAFGNTTAGKIAIAKQSYKDLKEEIGNNLLPSMNKLLEFVNGAIKGLPILAEKVKNTLSDVYTFFTEGPGAVKLAKAARIAEQLKQTESDVIQNNVSQFQDKSIEEVHAEIDRINQLVAAKNSYIKILEDAKKSDPTNFTKEDQTNLDNYTQGVRLLKGTLEGLFKLQDEKGNQQTLGNGDANYDPNAAKEAARKRAEDAKKILDDQQKLDEELIKLQHEYLGLQESEYQKELQAAFDKYEALKKLAHGNKDELQKIEVGFNEAIAAINKKYAQKALDEAKKLDDEQRKLREKQLADQLKNGYAFLDRLGKELENQAAKTNRTRNESEDLKIAAATGKQKHDLIKQQLDEQEQMEVAAAIKAGESVDVVREKFAQKQSDEDKRYFQERASMYIDFAQQISGIIGLIDQEKTNQENAELERDRKLNDKKKANLQAQLDKGIISREQYDKKVAELDKKQQARENAIAVEQFKRQQKEQVIQATINGAQAALKTLSQFGAPIPPNFLGIAAMALTIGTTIAQIAEIKKQKPPQFARGGKLYGRSHAEGGIAAVDNFGNKQAELEGDEGIINKQSMRDRSVYTVTGTPSQIASKINGIGGGVQWESGAALMPLWRTAPVARMNFSGIQNAFPRFAAGGQFGTTAHDNGNNEVLLHLVETVNNLNATLNGGIAAFVSIDHFNQQQARLNNIIDAATFK